VDSRVAGVPRLVDLIPSALPDVFEGEQVIVMGKYYGEVPVNVTITGNYLGEDREFAATFDPSKATTRNAFVPRLWATRRIGTLLDGIRQNPGSEGNKELVDEIVALSTEYGILTEYTAFLAASPEDMPVGRPGEPMPMSAAPAAWSDDEFREREMQRGLERRMIARDGAGSMNQEMNNASRAEAITLAAGENRYLDEAMRSREITTVQQVGDRAYFRHGRRWVDSSMLAQAADEPQQRVEFGTEAYTQLLDELIVDNRQAVLANRGEIYLMHRGQRVLVINPA
jgi:Ca-activated chloride channel family protein